MFGLVLKVVWSAPALSEEVAWKLNAKWTVATLLSQSLSDHGYVNRNYKQNQEHLIIIHLIKGRIFKTPKVTLQSI